MHSLLKTRTKISQDSWTNLGISEPKPRTKIPAGLLNKSWIFRTKTKNQDCCRTPEQILEFPNQNQEPRLLQDFWTNLGISEPQPRTKIAAGLLNKSWNFRTKTKNQDSCRTPEQILEFPNQNHEHCCRTPEQILEFPNQNQESRTKIAAGLLNKSWNFQNKTKNHDSPKTPEQILVLGFKPKILQRLLSKSCFWVLGFKSKIPQGLLSKSWFLVLGFKSKISQRLLSKSWFLVLGFKSKIPQRLLSNS